MAFLDNSGDIILDAVLTDTGRERLADGRFRITRFGLGDDEINYGLYDINHTSGSAYYDLEIMQIPIYEATTSINANINYGLLTLKNNNLLYLPALEINEKAEVLQGASRYKNVFYVCANAETRTQLLADSGGTTGPLSNNLIAAGDSGVPQAIFESGLASPDIAATQSERASYIMSNDLYDGTFEVTADSKFIVAVGQPGAGSTFANDSTNANDITIGINYVTANGASRDLEGFNSYTIRGIPNRIFENSGGDDNIYSALQGPRGSACSTNIDIRGELKTTVAGTRSQLYIDYGTVGASALSVGGTIASSTYDYIDTVLYIQGNASGATLQIPVRIIRLAST